MLQDIAPHRLINEYPVQNSLPVKAESFLLLRRGGELLCRIVENQLELPGTGEVPAALQYRYLIAVDENRFYMPLFPADSSGQKDIEKDLLEKGYDWHSSRDLRYAVPEWLRFGALTAWQAAGWYQNNRFCGRCGSPMETNEKERSLVCPDCGNTLYPKLCPVVIAAVTDGDRILLTRYANRSAYSRFALVAGFAEIGETIEETVAREVLEETGLKVKNLQYYKSQPWAYSESLLFGFFCEADGSTEITVDTNELSTAEWVNREDIPEYGDEISLTYEMMRCFRENKNR